jgi:hypothetical protein
MICVAPVEDRFSEVGWVLDYLPDLEADFRAWYGVTNMLALPAPEFFRLASRTVAFEGVMRVRAQSLQDAETAEDTHMRAARRPRPTSDVTPESVAAAGLDDLISFGRPTP